MRRLASFFGGRLWLICLKTAIALVFIYAGGTKLWNLQAFADSVVTFAVIPNSFANIVALTVPFLELFLGLSLLVGFRRRAAALGVVVLSLLFLLLFSQAKLRGLNINCGCFGGGESSVGMGLARAMVLFAASAWLYLLFASRDGLRRINGLVK